MINKKNQAIKKQVINWLDENHNSILEGKKFFTPYDVVKLIADKYKLESDFIFKIIDKDKQLKQLVQSWLENVFWHVGIALKIAPIIELYREQYFDITKKSEFKVIDDIKLWKQLDGFKEGFTVNNPKDGKPEITNEYDEITNFGKESDYLDDF